MGFNEYDVAQICINGHLINVRAQGYAIHNREHCNNCGAETITQCPKCQHNIKGRFVYPGISSSDYKVPFFCDNCGEPYPWTSAKLEAVNELSKLSNLEDAEQKELNKSILELIRETPKVPLAQVVVKRYLEKLGNDISEAIHDILIDGISETIKSKIWNNK